MPKESFRTEGDVNLSQRRLDWSTRNLNDATRELLAEDERFYLRQSLSTPCLNAIERCEGIYLVDVQGRRIMDFHGNSAHQLGYGHPRVISAVKEQMDRLSFCPRRYTNESAVALARKLCELAPAGLNKVLLTPSGATAIGIALKLVRYATGRFKTLSLWDSFHGASLDAISIGGESLFRRDVGPLLPGSEHAPPPSPAGCPFACGQTCNLKCAEYIDYVLEKEGDIGAVVAETVRSTTAVVPPPGYWPRIREICDQHGALLILDEIPTSPGRSGQMFCCEHYHVTPDILVLGKGLGGGIWPLAAVIARGELDVAANRAVGHYTHEKNPVAAAAGLATLQCIEQEGLLDRARRLGAYAIERLRHIQQKHPLVAEVRGLGLLLGVELKWHGANANEEAERVLYGCLERGLSFKVSDGNVLSLGPPLTITEAELERAIDIIDETITDVEL